MRAKADLLHLPGVNVSGGFVVPMPIMVSLVGERTSRLAAEPATTDVPRNRRQPARPTLRLPEFVTLPPGLD
jgi:hypothetical protein